MRNRRLLWTSEPLQRSLVRPDVFIVIRINQPPFRTVLNGWMDGCHSEGWMLTVFLLSTKSTNWSSLLLFNRSLYSVYYYTEVYCLNQHCWSLYSNIVYTITTMNIMNWLFFFFLVFVPLFVHLVLLFKCESTVDFCLNLFYLTFCLYIFSFWYFKFNYFSWLLHISVNIQLLYRFTQQRCG